MKKLLISLLCLLLTINIFSAGISDNEPFTAITDEGKLIKLYDIGRWEYIDDEINLTKPIKNSDDEWLPLLEGSDILYNNTIFETLSSRDGTDVNYILNNGRSISNDDWKVLKDFIGAFQKSDYDYVLDTISKLYFEDDSRYSIIKEWIYTIVSRMYYTYTSNNTAFIMLNWGIKRVTKIDIENIKVNLIFSFDESSSSGDLYKVKCFIDNVEKNLSYSIIQPYSYWDQVFAEFDLNIPENLELAREIAFSKKTIIEYYTDKKMIKLEVSPQQKDDLKVMYRLIALLLNSIDK